MIYDDTYYEIMSVFILCFLFLMISPCIFCRLLSSFSYNDDDG